MKSRLRYEGYNHAKFSIKYHIILSVKYHKRILQPIIDCVKRGLLKAQPADGSWKILVMETDIEHHKDHHVHLLVKARPIVAPSNIITRLKLFSTHEVWNENETYLKRAFWNGKRHLWSRGFFCATVGEVSEKKVVEYIRRQE